MAALVARDDESLARYREIVGGAVDVMIGRGLPQAGAIELEHEPKEQMGDYAMVRGLVQYPAKGEEVPILVLGPGPEPWNNEVVIWVDAAGKQALFDEGGKPRPAVKQLLAAGMAVVGVDLFGQGEFTADGKPIAKARLDPKRAGYAGYTYGYNHPVFSKRVHDLLSLVALARSVRTVEKVHLVGLHGAGHWVAAARAQAGKAVDRAVVDTDGFRFANLTDFADPDFLPGGAKYLDLPGMLALSAPGELWVAGEGPRPPAVVLAAYQAAGALANLTVVEGEKSLRDSAAVEWLLR
jgi:hypothetical protein